MGLPVVIWLPVVSCVIIIVRGFMEAGWGLLMALGLLFLFQWKQFLHVYIQLYRWPTISPNSRPTPHQTHTPPHTHTTSLPYTHLHFLYIWKSEHVHESKLPERNNSKNRIMVRRELEWGRPKMYEWHSIIKRENNHRSLQTACW